MIKSTNNGREVYYDGENWIYSDTNLIIEDNPNWNDRCSNDGYEVDDEGKGMFPRPCKYCNQFPNEDGDDHCIKRLGNVINACCGHGNRKGYIQFDNGYRIEGFFHIEKKDENGIYRTVVNHTNI